MYERGHFKERTWEDISISASCAFLVTAKKRQSEISDLKLGNHTTLTFVQDGGFRDPLGDRPYEAFDRCCLADVDHKIESLEVDRHVLACITRTLT